MKLRGWGRGDVKGDDGDGEEDGDGDEDRDGMGMMMGMVMRRMGVGMDSGMWVVKITCSLTAVSNSKSIWSPAKPIGTRAKNTTGGGMGN